MDAVQSARSRLGVATVALLLSAPLHTAAAIDLTGKWRVTQTISWSPISYVESDRWVIRQSDRRLTISSEDGERLYQGDINRETGELSFGGIRGLFCTLKVDIGSDHFSGIAPDDDAFTASGSMYALPVPRFCGPKRAEISATRIPCDDEIGCEPPAPQCAGDCDADELVSVGELVRCVNVVMGSETLESCESCDIDGNGQVNVGELVAGVGNLLAGCP